MIYQFVQMHYWNNGFLNYFTLQQSPNFLLALPMILITVFGVTEYFFEDPIRFLTLGSVVREGKGNQVGFLQDRMLPHVYLWTFMFITCLLFMHVQVMQRFLSGIPVLYWYAAHRLQKQSTFIIYYCVIYNLIATTLFAKFYPPA